METIPNDDELKQVLTRPNGYLVNHNSDVDHNGRDVVHVLPLISGCRGKIMKVTREFPKSYVSDRSGLSQLGVKGQDWEFGKCCQGRPGTY